MQFTHLASKSVRLQKLCKAHLHFAAELPANLRTTWLKEVLQQWRLPRKQVTFANTKDATLHIHLRPSQTRPPGGPFLFFEDLLNDSATSSWAVRYTLSRFWHLMELHDMR